VVRLITELRAKHSKKEGTFYGIDGNTGKIADMREADIWDPVAVKIQTLKTSIECAAMILRIDDIVSGLKKVETKSGQQGADEDVEETFGDERDG
jgi:T-complex protein 1 subunit gamma